MSKTILLDCPFCLNKTICSCCGQCINPECDFKHDNPDYELKSQKAHYDNYVKILSKAKIPAKTFEEWIAIDVDSYYKKLGSD